MNPFRDIDWNPDLATRRRFARSLVIGFPIIAAALLIVTRVMTHGWKPFPIWLGAVGMFLGLVLWLLPQVARPFYTAWYFIACCMGLVVGNVLLSACYYLLLTPIGLLLRTSGNRLTIGKRFDKGCPTYWQDAEKVNDPERYYRQF